MSGMYFRRRPIECGEETGVLHIEGITAPYIPRDPSILEGYIAKHKAVGHLRENALMYSGH